MKHFSSGNLDFLQNSQCRSILLNELFLSLTTLFSQLFLFQLQIVASPSAMTSPSGTKIVFKAGKISVSEINDTSIVAN